MKAVPSGALSVPGLLLFGLIAAGALFAGRLAPYDPWARSEPYRAPDAEHWLGTNDVGNDILSELLWGGRVSILVGLGTGLLATSIGLFVGLLAGYCGGAVDELLMGAIDVVLMVPRIPLLIMVSAFLTPAAATTAVVLGLLWWTSTARVVRSRVLQIRQRTFVAAQRSLGFGDARIMLTDILPHIVSVLLPKLMLTIASAMITEASPSFLGLGDPAAKSWGAMIRYAFERGGFIRGMWWWYVSPGAATTLCVLGLVLIGMRAATLPGSDRRAAGIGGDVSCLHLRELTVEFPTPTGTLRAVDRLSLDHPAERTLALIGESGCGKSAIVKQLADDRKCGFIDLRLSLLDPTDLRGLPFLGGDTAFWAPPVFLPRTGSGILFLDELNAAPPAIQSGAYQLVLDRRVGEYVLPEGWRIVAAGNRETDRAVTYRMPTPLRNRFLHLEIQPYLEDRKSWALPHGIRPEIVSFLSFRPGLLFSFEPGSLDPAFPTPCSWEYASDIPECGLAPHEMRLALTGVLGGGPAVELWAFLELARDLPTVDAIFAGQDIVPDILSVLYALCGNIVQRAEENIDRVLEYSLKLPPEFAVLLVQDIQRLRGPILYRSPVWKTWAERSREVTL